MARETILCGPPALTKIQALTVNQAEDLSFFTLRLFPVENKTSEDVYPPFLLFQSVRPSASKNVFKCPLRVKSLPTPGLNKKRLTLRNTSSCSEPDGEAGVTRPRTPLS